MQKTLFGDGGVQGLDHEAHRHRKAMFTALMTDARIRDLAAESARRWRALVPQLAKRAASCFTTKRGRS